MKKFFIILVLLVLSLTFALPAMAQTRTLTVSGNASVAVQADKAVLTVGVVQEKPSVLEAQEESAVLINSIINALLDYGIENKDIETQRFSLYSHDRQTETGERETVYSLTNTLQVTLYDTENVGTVLDLAMKAGANVLHGIDFETSKRKEAYNEALAQAVQDAKDNATLLASLSGVTLKEITDIHTGSTGISYDNMNDTYRMESAKGADTKIISGDVVVSATVTIEYEIQ